MKLHKRPNTEEGEIYAFWCVACECMHSYPVGPNTEWTFNEDMDFPTFEPSLLHENEGLRIPRCHLYVTAGKIRYMGDSGHRFAGRVVDMKDF